MNNELFYTEPADYESIMDMADRLMGNDLPDDAESVTIEGKNGMMAAEAHHLRSRHNG